MNLKINKDYILRFQIKDKIFTYYCKILSIDEKSGFLEFRDLKYKVLWNYNLKNLISFQELNNEVREV